MPVEPDLTSLRTFLSRIPAIEQSMDSGNDADGRWWVKLVIDIDHALAWNVVQELGCVLNYLSLEERLPTVFKPVSPAPYLNGGPREYLSWIIESSDPAFAPDTCREWLEGRLPNPVDDLSAWETDDDDEGNQGADHE